MNKIQQSIKHIEQVHASIYTKTFNKELLAGKRSILKINLKEIEKNKSEIKHIQKENRKLRAEIRAYERVTEEAKRQ